jgi:hypothetical protein
VRPPINRKVQQAQDPFDAVLLPLVLPQPDHTPARCPQCIVGPSITCPVCLDFLSPERLVASRPRGMDGASMPEATVDEYGKLARRERDVNRAPGLTRDRVVYPVAKPPTKQSRAQRPFERIVAPVGARHASARRQICWRGCRGRRL